jgi:hypothetical protein
MKLRRWADSYGLGELMEAARLVQTANHLGLERGSRQAGREHWQERQWGAKKQ